MFGRMFIKLLLFDNYIFENYEEVRDNEENSPPISIKVSLFVKIHEFIAKLTPISLV